MNPYNDCGGCDDDEIGCQKCSIELFALWTYRPVHAPVPHYRNARCWVSMAEIRLINGLEQTSRDRCLSATPHRRRKAARRHLYLRQEMSNASGNDQDKEDCEDDPKRAHFAVSAPNPLSPRA
jgi:hypothetical protein